MKPWYETHWNTKSQSLNDTLIKLVSLHYWNITWGCFGVGWRHEASKVNHLSWSKDEWSSHSHGAGHRVGSLRVSGALTLHCFLQVRSDMSKTAYSQGSVVQTGKYQTPLSLLLPAMLYRADFCTHCPRELQVLIKTRVFLLFVCFQHKATDVRLLSHICF